MTEERSISDQSVSERSIGSTLLARMQANDPDAWHKVSFLFGPVIEGWCRRTGLQDSDAQDVAQEVFRTVSLHRNDFRRDRPGDTFRGWLWTVTQNKIKEFWRRRSRQPLAQGGSSVWDPIESSGDVSTVAPSSVAEEKALLHRSLELVRARFEEKTWQAFWLTTVEDHTAPEAGAKLGMSSGAVYVAKSRVIAKLREELSEFFDEDFKL